MAKELKTGWVIVATSGQTIDGREVKKEWLTDMAKHYNPRVYLARLWPEHERWFGAHGKVLALKTEPATDPELKDEIHLMAIVAPSDGLLEANKRGRWTHTSIEVLKNFANKGYFYLGGLAVTDTPASLGTSELQFSESADRFRIAGDQLDLSTATEKEQSFLSRFFKSDDTPQDNTMDKEQFELFMAALNKQTEAFTALSEKITQSKTPAGAEEEETPVVTAEQFTALQQQHTELMEKFTDLSTKFEEAIKTPTPGTQTDPGDGGAQKELY